MEYLAKIFTLVVQKALYSMLSRSFNINLKPISVNYFKEKGEEKLYKDNSSL